MNILESNKLVAPTVILILALTTISCTTLEYESGLGMRSPQGLYGEYCDYRSDISGTGTNIIFFNRNGLNTKIKIPNPNNRSTVALAPFFIPLIPFFGAFYEPHKDAPALSFNKTLKVEIKVYDRNKPIFLRKDTEKAKFKGNHVFNPKSIYFEKNGREIRPSLIEVKSYVGSVTKISKLDKTPIESLSYLVTLILSFDLSIKDILDTVLIFDAIEVDGKRILKHRRKIQIQKSEGYWYKGGVINC